MFSLYKLKCYDEDNEKLCGCCCSEELTVPCLGQLYCDDVPVSTSRVALFVVT